MIALSLSSSLTTVGALAAFAALLGIAVLSLLVFSQAREIKRLREWAGRAPERAAELEQRVSTQAASRIQREGAPAGAVRVTPRTTPLVSAPVSSAVQASAAVATGSHPLVRAPAPVGANAPAPSAAPGAPVSSSPEAPESERAGEATMIATPEAAGAPPQPGPAAAGTPAPMAEVDELPADSSEQPAALGAAPGGGADASHVNDMSEADDLSGEGEVGDPEDSVDATPAPATAAALAARSPLPPSPSEPAPPAARRPAMPAVPAAPLRTAEPLPRSEVRRAPARPPAPGAPSRRAPSRAMRPSGPTGAGSASRGAANAGGASTNYYKQQRSPARATALIVAAAIAGVLLIVLIVSALKGSSGPGPSGAGRAASPLVQARNSHGSAHQEHAQAASNPSEVLVVVLNGTSTAGLAHHLASDLQQTGYSRAEASAAVPSGSHSTTTVEYTSGHRADGQAVAKALNVTRVQPIDSSTASLAQSATVVVLAGADQAALLGGGGTHSAGEPAAGGSAGGETGAASEAPAGEAPAGAAEEGTGEAAAGAAH